MRDRTTNDRPDFDPSRRRACKAALVTTLLPMVGAPARATPPIGAAESKAASAATPRVGLALGSGGARGLSHVLIFEALEALGVRPYRIAGCSIGAIMGALFAAGLSSKEIHQGIDDLIADQQENWFDTLLSGKWRQWLGFLQPSDRDGGLLESNAFISHLQQVTGKRRFEELEIPLEVVATDYWERKMAVFDRGPLWPAVQASMAMPGLFSPVEHNGMVLVDGGLTNPLPYDLLLDDCDLVIAVNVLGTRQQEEDKALRNPTYFDNSFNTFQVMQQSILNAKLDRARPDFLVTPEIRNVRVLDFHRADEIFAQAQPAVDTFREALERALESA